MPLTFHKKKSRTLHLPPFVSTFHILLSSSGSSKKPKYKYIWALSKNKPKTSKRGKDKSDWLKTKLFCLIMKRQFPTLGRKLAGDFLPKVGEGRNYSLCHLGLAPPTAISWNYDFHKDKCMFQGLMMHFRLVGP